MQFITGNNRHQTFFSALEEQVSIDNAVRLIDTFIDKPDLEKMGFTKTIHKSEGRNFFTYGCKKNCFVCHEQRRGTTAKQKLMLR